MFKYITIFRLHSSANKHWYFKHFSLIQFKLLGSETFKTAAKIYFLYDQRNVKYVADISCENILLSLLIRSLVIKWRGIVSVTTFLAYYGSCLAFVAAFLSLYKVKMTCHTSGLANSARVFTPDPIKGCIYCCYH